MYEQISVFLMSCVIGGVLGLIYDLFKISRMAIKTHKVIVLCEDVIFFVITALISFAFIMVDNNGEVRGLLIIGEVIGAVIYFFTISVVLIKCSEMIIKIAKWIIRLIYFITLRPIIKLLLIIFNHIQVKIIQLKLGKLLNEQNNNN